MRLIDIATRATAEVDNFVRVRALCSDPKDFTVRFRATLTDMAGTKVAPLASAILAELDSREA